MKIAYVVRELVSLPAGENELFTHYEYGTFRTYNEANKCAIATQNPRCSAHIPLIRQRLLHRIFFQVELAGDLTIVQALRQVYGLLFARCQHDLAFGIDYVHGRRDRESVDNDAQLFRVRSVLSLMNTGDASTKRLEGQVTVVGPDP